MQCSINFLINGDARLVFGLLKYEISVEEVKARFKKLTFGNIPFQCL